MLGFVSSTAGAFYGIANGLWIVWKEAGSTPESTTKVVGPPLPCPANECLNLPALPRRAARPTDSPGAAHAVAEAFRTNVIALLFWSSKSSDFQPRLRPRLTRHQFSAVSVRDSSTSWLPG